MVEWRQLGERLKHSNPEAFEDLLVHLRELVDASEAASCAPPLDLRQDIRPEPATNPRLAMSAPRARISR